MSNDDKATPARQLDFFQLQDLKYTQAGDVHILRPENALVAVLGYAHFVDFGSWCFTRHNGTKADSRSAASSIRIVKKESLRVQRRTIIRDFIGYVALLHENSTSEKTLRHRISRFRRYVYWCDENFIAGLDDKRRIKQSFRQYSSYLQRECQLGNLKRNTAARYQGEVLTTLTTIFEDVNGYFTQGVKRISTNKAAYERTSCPTAEEAQLSIQVSMCLFLQLSAFILSEDDFPHEVTLPNHPYWFFPNTKPFLRDDETNERSIKRRYLAYNYKDGSVRTAREITQLMGSGGMGAHNAATRARQLAEDKIAAANTNKFHPHRIFAASLAADCFMNLFAANTAMNASGIATIPWQVDYDVSRKQQKFKTIKPRAGYTETEFVISSGFLKHFKTFLKIRSFLLQASNVDDFPQLFFRISNNELRPQTDKFSNLFNERIDRYFGVKLTVTTRQWRVFKSDWLIKLTDVSTAAMALQNSVQTLLSHYAEGTESAAREEITSHFSQYKSQLLATSNESTEPVPSGNCTNYGKPEPLPDIKTENQNCISGEGCFGCKHYRVHADLGDLTKLLSFRYVLELSGSLAKNGEHRNSIQMPIIQRIKAVEAAVIEAAGIDYSTVEHLRKLVFEDEQLHPYWSKKLDMLTRLEVL